MNQNFTLRYQQRTTLPLFRLGGLYGIIYRPLIRQEIQDQLLIGHSELRGRALILYPGHWGRRLHLQNKSLFEFFKYFIFNMFIILAFLFACCHDILTLGQIRVTLHWKTTSGVETLVLQLNYVCHFHNITWETNKHFQIYNFNYFIATLQQKYSFGVPL